MIDVTDDAFYENASTNETFERFIEIIKILRSPSGCPWDREQTAQTLRRALIEEAYEAVAAINEKNDAHVKEELGDVLLNAFMIASIYQEKGSFSLSEVFNAVCEKLIRRHPHVWQMKSATPTCDAKPKIQNAQDVVNQWENIKTNVEGRKQKCALDEVSYGKPPLCRAEKLQKKAAKLGFDWEDAKPIWDKIYEELDELKRAYDKQDKDNIEEEVGDVLFSVVNLARHFDVDAELALSRANQKFRDRFAFVQEQMEKNGVPMEKKNLAQMDEAWNRTKNK